MFFTIIMIIVLLVVVIVDVSDSDSYIEKRNKDHNKKETDIAKEENVTNGTDEDEEKDDQGKDGDDAGSDDGKKPEPEEEKIPKTGADALEWDYIYPTGMKKEKKVDPKD